MSVPDALKARRSNQIQFRLDVATLNRLVSLAEQAGMTPHIAAKTIVKNGLDASPTQQTLNALIERVLVLDELVRLLLSSVEQSRINEAEHYARLRAIETIPEE